MYRRAIIYTYSFHNAVSETLNRKMFQKEKERYKKISE
jgi:hypothetical protein